MLRNSHGGGEWVQQPLPPENHDSAPAGVPLPQGHSSTWKAAATPATNIDDPPPHCAAPDAAEPPAVEAFILDSGCLCQWQ
jgi:hypothetical protein